MGESASNINDLTRNVALGGMPPIQVVTLFDNQLLTYRQANKCFGIGITELKRAKSRGLIDWYPAGEAGTGVRFRVSAIKTYLDSREVKRRTA